MISTLVLGAALAAPAAPVPRDATPAPASPAPWVLYLKADQNGRIQLMSYKSVKVKGTRTVIENQNGKRIAKTVEEETTQIARTSFLLDERSAKFETAAGSNLNAGQVMKQTRDGIVVLVSADGKPVEKAWLQAVGEDAIVMTADNLSKSELPPVSSMRLSTAAPRLVLLGTDAEGKVKVTCNPNGNRNAAAPGRVVFINNGAGVQQIVLGGEPLIANPGQVAVEYKSKALEDVTFDAYDLSGKRVPRETALKRLRAGGLVLISGDNRIPDESYLKLFRGDLLVLVSPELLSVPLNPGVIPPGQPLPVPVARPVLRLAPALVPARPALVVPARPLAVPPKPADAPKPAADRVKPARAIRELPARAPVVPATPK